MELESGRYIQRDQSSGIQDQPAPSQVAVRSEEDAPQQGSGGLVLLGAVLLVLSHAAANVFCISSLYGFEKGTAHGVGSAEQQLMPFGETPIQQWAAYGAASAVVVLALIMVGSQPFVQSAAVVYVFCPLAAAATLAGWPLRRFPRHAIPLATAYLGLGSALAGGGAVYLTSSYGASDVGGSAALSSMLLQFGLALGIGALITFVRSKKKIDEDPAEQRQLVPIGG
jgi:hypothetical protein